MEWLKESVEEILDLLRDIVEIDKDVELELEQKIQEIITRCHDESDEEEY